MIQYLRNKFKNLKPRTKAGIIGGLALIITSLTGCGEIKNLLGKSTQGTATHTAGTIFSDDTLEARLKAGNPSNVEGAYQIGQGDWVNGSPTVDANGDHVMTIPTSNPKDCNIEWTTTCGITENTITDNASIKYNEAQGDVALENVLNEIGVYPGLGGNPAPVPTGETKGRIKAYAINSNYGGREYDARVSVHCGNPPFYTEYYFIKLKGSQNDKMTQADIDNVQVMGYGALEISGSNTVEQVKNAITAERNKTNPHNWPQIVNW